MELIDKQKHRDEFRLRILLTDKCDKNCSNCLNDFQPKGNNFIDLEFVKKNIVDYIKLCKSRGIKPIISISGGEPGLHKDFAKIYYFASLSGAKVQINTNGLIDGHVFDSHGPDIRYHMGHGLRNTIVKGQTAVIVISSDYSYEENKAFIKIFHDGGMKVKTFADYYSSERFRTVVYPEMLRKLNKHFKISGRHTGVQENRGCGCMGCQKTCITLKALWLFPDNTSSYCPQKHEGVMSVEDAYIKHLTDSPYTGNVFSPNVWNKMTEFLED